MRKISILVTVLVLALLSGCGSMIPMNFSVMKVGLAQKKIDAELKSLTVSVAQKGEATGSFDFQSASLGDSNPSEAATAQIIPQQWQASLIEAVNTMAIFQDDATKKVNLSVKILKIQMDIFAVPNKVTTTEARYEITDRKTGDLIYTQNITSTGVINISTCLSTCIRQSLNLAVQNNILQFLQALETVDVKKPMFPVKSGATSQ